MSTLRCGVLALEDLPIVLVIEDDELIQSIVEDALFAPGKEKPGKPAGRLQVKLGNRSAEIQTCDSIPSAPFLTEEPTLP